MIIHNLSLGPTDFCIQQQFQKGQDSKLAPHIKEHQMRAMMKYQTLIATNETVEAILVLCQHPQETDCQCLGGSTEVIQAGLCVTIEAFSFSKVCNDSVDYFRYSNMT